MEVVMWWRRDQKKTSKQHPIVEGQEPQPPWNAPDMDPLPDTRHEDVPEHDMDDVADDSGVPPFTGEDVEDVGRRPSLGQAHDCA
jgi:hypothetical protein